MIYLFLKSVHLAAVLTFTGGLVLLAVASPGRVRVGGVVLPHELGIGRAILRWDRYVTVPAMLGSWVLGLSLAVTGGWMGQGWLMIKMAVAIMLSGMHGILRAALRRYIEGDTTTRPSWHAYSPVMVTAGISIIALLVTFKPFMAGRS